MGDARRARAAACNAQAPESRSDETAPGMASRLRPQLAARRRDGRADRLGAHGPAGARLRRDRGRAGPERALRHAARGRRLSAAGQLAPPLRRSQRDGGDDVRLDGRPRRHREHGLGRLHRPDRCADADGRRDLHRRRARPDGVRRPLLRAAGARGLHRRARPLHRHRPAAEGGGHREAVGQHALGARGTRSPTSGAGNGPRSPSGSSRWSRCSRSPASRRSSRA